MSSGVEVVGPDHVRDPATGAELSSESRDRLRFTSAGHSIGVFVERDARGITAWLPSVPRWDDGTELSAAEVDNLQSILRAAGQQWQRPVTFG